MELNRRNLLNSVPYNPEARFLDLGCDDGDWTLKLAERIGTSLIQGVEVVESRASEARERGVEVEIVDLANQLSFPNAHFDIVHANQVIEHVPDIDLFASEILRILRPKGIAVISTENASSWHNIFALLWGWQMFSLSNLSDRKLGIGNPLALHRDEVGVMKSWTHKVIFSYRGLIEFFQAHGFKVKDVKGAGYYPLPAVFGKIDPRHAHFLTITIEKP